MTNLAGKRKGERSPGSRYFPTFSRKPFVRSVSLVSSSSNGSPRGERGDAASEDGVSSPLVPLAMMDRLSSSRCLPSSSLSALPRRLPAALLPSSVERLRPRLCMRPAQRPLMPPFFRSGSSSDPALQTYNRYLRFGSVWRMSTTFKPWATHRASTSLLRRNQA